MKETVGKNAWSDEQEPNLRVGNICWLNSYDGAGLVVDDGYGPT